MKKYYQLLLLIFCTCLFSCETAEKGVLNLSPLFSNHMVLQQQAGAALWGTYSSASQITVTGSWGDQATTSSDESGQWQVQLNTPEAGGPYEISVLTKDTTVIIQDVMIGEVWLASGQSNMEMPVSGWPPNDPIRNSDQEIAQANNSEIRMFTVTKNLSISPIDTVSGLWEPASPETVGAFSATAYFFARRLYEELQVPIGIIHTSWGGTVAEAWTSNEQLRVLGDFNDALDKMADPEGPKQTKAWFEQWSPLPLPQSPQQWETISFQDLAVTENDYDDSNWETLTLPGRYDDLPSGEINGAIWLRHQFQVEKLDADYVLEIGAVDDMDATYVNGQKVGGLLGYNTPRNYKVPRSILVQGTNTLTIRAIDTGGPGAIHGAISLNSNSGSTLSLEGDWKYRPMAEIYNNQFYVYDLESDKVAARPPIFQAHPNLPSVLYNGMLHPLIPYAIKGALWYQGESNVGRSEQYKKLFPAMIKDWRTRWGYEFPFYFVQIAPFQYNQSTDVNLDQSQKLRDAQRHSLQTSSTGMVVTMDIGNLTNIHPANKQDVGARLAGLALANDYGKNLVASGPLFKDIEKVGDKVIVDFHHKGSGLIAKDDLKGFEIAGADKLFVPATASIIENKVQVYSASVTAPEFVRYAWQDQGVATLFNQEGLPASSFTSKE